MSDDRQEELAAHHALDLLEGAERADFERSLAADPNLRALGDQLRESAAALSHAAPAGAAPGAALKSRILASAGSIGSKIIRPPPSAFRPLLPWAAAAGFALLAAWFAQAYFSARTETQVLATQQLLADLALKRTGQQLEAERILARGQLAGLDRQLADARTQIATLDDRIKREADLANLKITALASMLKNSPEAIAVAVWNPARQEGVLKVDRLPALAADQDYQLWVVDPQYPNPVDGGVFTVDAQTGAQKVVFKARQPVRAIDAFAVTLERKGGVPKAEGPFVLLGK